MNRRKHFRARWSLAACICVGALAGVSTSGTAGADDPIPQPQALGNQPRVMDGRIYSIDTFGSNVVVGGTFTQIRAAAGGANIAQPYIFKFNVNTGLIDNAFRPTFNGPVEGIRFTPGGQSLFVGGDFTTVNGQSRRRMVKLNASTGAVNATFVANTNNIVKDLDLSNGRVVIGGRFIKVNGVSRQRLAMLDPTTGAPLSSFNLPVTQSRFQYAPYVQELETSADGRWLVLGGNFMNVGGAERHQIAVVDLSGAQATVANWSTNEYVGDCASVYDDTWIRGIDISPDSTWFTVGTTGAHFGSRRLCDTATRWELPPQATGSAILPTWTIHTGGDTHWAMHITNGAVFAGGHQRWENNPHPSPGDDGDGPGAVSRMGVAALDPLTGVPLSWNPGRDRRRGIEAWASTASHVFAGSDSAIWAGQIRQRLAVLPYAGGTMNPTPDNLVLPVDMRFAVDDRLYSTHFEGSTFTPPTQVSGTGIDSVNWNEVRDGFVQRDRFVYYGPTGRYFSRPITGNTFGAITTLSDTVGYVDTTHNITPSDQPYGVAETVAATYKKGRIYYTKTGDSRLYWRWYSIESGIIGGREEVAAGGNFTQARALDAIGGWLYVAWSDGRLYRAKLLSNGGVNMTTWAVVDNGATIDWENVDSMFSTQSSGPSTPPPDPVPLQCNNPALPWRAVYHSNMTLNAPTTKRCEAVVSQDWGSGSPPGTAVGADQFSARWKRTLSVTAGARLRIHAGSDDGIRVFVDGALVVNDWVNRSFASRIVETGPLSGGSHGIVVEFYEDGGAARVLADITQVGP